MNAGEPKESLACKKTLISFPAALCGTKKNVMQHHSRNEAITEKTRSRENVNSESMRPASMTIIIRSPLQTARDDVSPPLLRRAALRSAPPLSFLWGQAVLQPVLLLEGGGLHLPEPGDAPLHGKAALLQGGDRGREHALH